MQSRYRLQLCFVVYMRPTNQSRLSYSATIDPSSGPSTLLSAGIEPASIFQQSRQIAFTNFAMTVVMVDLPGTAPGSCLPLLSAFKQLISYLYANWRPKSISLLLFGKTSSIHLPQQ